MTGPQETGAVGRGAAGHPDHPREVGMSGLMTSVAMNLLVIVIFFLAAVLMTVGMLGIR